MRGLKDKKPLMLIKNIEEMWHRKQGFLRKDDSCQPINASVMYDFENIIEFKELTKLGN